MAQILIGDNAVAKPVSSLFFGNSNNQAVRVISGFVGDSNGEAKQILTSNIIIEWHAEFECWIHSGGNFMSGKEFQYRYVNNYIKILNPSAVKSAVSIPIKMYGDASIHWSGGSKTYVAFNENDNLTKSNPEHSYVNNWWQAGETQYGTDYATMYAYFEINGTRYILVNYNSGVNIFTNWTKVATVNRTEQIIIPA